MRGVTLDAKLVLCKTVCHKTIGGSGALAWGCPESMRIGTHRNVIDSTHGCRLPRPPEHDLENVDELTSRVFHRLGEIMHLNRLVMMKMIAGRGVQPPEAFALTFISHNDGISQRELAAGLHLSRPRVSMIMRTLEDNGAVLRRPDETDRRLARVFLTPEGRRREAEHRGILAEYVRRTLGALPEADRGELDRLLGSLAERIVLVLQEEQVGTPQREEVKTR
jgi:DNA-binding MarR family transcriptional regulator